MHGTKKHNDIRPQDVPILLKVDAHRQRCTRKSARETTVVFGTLLLQKDKWIKKHTGKFNGYGTHHTDSSSVKKNQAEVKVTLFGKKRSLFVHCLMELTIDGEWGIKELLKREARLRYDQA